MELDQEKLRKFLINSAWGASAIRNQGKGVSLAIREMLINHLHPEEALKHIRRKNSTAFEKYLDKLTQKVHRKKGYSYKKIKSDQRKVFYDSKVYWGTARKCINLCLRTVFYNAFIWEQYGITGKDFSTGGAFQKLELPMDSYSFKGLKKYAYKNDINKFKSVLKTFSIRKLNSKQSGKLQKLANKAAKDHNISRVDLDVLFWRGEDGEND